VDDVKHLRYVLNLTSFAFRANPLLYVSVGVSLFSAAIELLAMSSLLPLFELVSGAPPSRKTIVARGISLVGLPVSAQTLLWAFIILFASRILTQIIGQSIATFLGKRVMAQLCSGAFDQIIHRLSIREVNEKSIGFYISLAGDESFRASTLVLSLTQFISIAALAILYFSAIALYSPTAAGLVLVFLVCCLVAMIRVVRLSHRLGTRSTTESRKAGTLFLDALNNLKAVRAFSAEGYVVAMHRTLIFGYAKVLFWVDEVSMLTRLIPVLLLFALFGIWLACSGQNIQAVGIAFVVTMVVYLMRFFPVVGQGVTLLMRIAADAKTGGDVTAILQTKANPQNVALGVLGRIERVDLRQLCFSYNDNADKRPVLYDVNLVLERGKSYAVAGRSGVGKSTLVDILLKFYQPTSGQLCLNGIPISNVADSELRKRVILVSQEAAIFDDTVKNNICMGLDAELPAVQAVCQTACIDDFIQAMDHGYATRLQYRGANLSGGQRQRIAIARALLRKADLLILDEGTSALDKATQVRVVENILREYSDRIVVFVTHDPAVMGRVDEVIDLEKVNASALPLGHSAGTVT
jgi:ABC-type multidrug transport system fused ATPase/permease subunit